MVASTQPQMASRTGAFVATMGTLLVAGGPVVTGLYGAFPLDLVGLITGALALIGVVFGFWLFASNPHPSLLSGAACLIGAGLLAIVSAHSLGLLRSLPALPTPEVVQRSAASVFGATPPPPLAQRAPGLDQALTLNIRGASGNGASFAGAVADEIRRSAAAKPAPADLSRKVVIAATVDGAFGNLATRAVTGRGNAIIQRADGGGACSYALPETSGSLASVAQTYAADLLTKAEQTLKGGSAC